VKILNKINSFILVVVILYLIQNYTIGLIPFTKRYTIEDKVYWKDIVFILSSILIAAKYFRFAGGSK